MQLPSAAAGPGPATRAWVWILVAACVLLIVGAGTATAAYLGLFPVGFTTAEKSTTPPVLALGQDRGNPVATPTAAAPATIIAASVSTPTAATTPTPTTTPSPTTAPTTARPSPTPSAIPSPTTAPAVVALGRVAQEGYSVPDPSTYDVRSRLRVLLGNRVGSSTDHRAFFFLGDQYLGTDTLVPSASPLAVVSQDTLTVAIRYLLYRTSDSDCCPSAGSAVVRYAWNGERLTPLDPIPTEDRQTNLSRR